MSTSNQAQAQAQEKLVWLARLGYGTRGVVYIIVGALALLAALGEGGGTTDTKGALHSVMSSPFGDIMIGIIAFGLFSYALWRFVQAVKDVDDHGTDPKGLAIRGGLLVSAVTHTLLGVYAVNMLFGFGGGNGGGGSKGMAATLMQQPWGRWLVGIAALCVLGAGVAHMLKALKEKYKKYFAMDSSLMKKVSPIIKFGLIARAVVFAIIAFFLAYAAWTYDPQKAKGLDAALEFIQQQAYGSILLGVVALGLFAFGAYSFLEGIYRRIHPG
ncbi:MAG: DUF1206 domain-containing protein [Desulforhopalus sp.]